MQYNMQTNNYAHVTTSGKCGTLCDAKTTGDTPEVARHWQRALGTSREWTNTQRNKEKKSEEYRA